MFANGLNFFNATKIRDFFPDLKKNKLVSFKGTVKEKWNGV